MRSRGSITRRVGVLISLTRRKYLSMFCIFGAYEGTSVRLTVANRCVAGPSRNIMPGSRWRSRGMDSRCSRRRTLERVVSLSSGRAEYGNWISERLLGRNQHGERWLHFKALYICELMMINNESGEYCKTHRLLCRLLCSELPIYVCLAATLVSSHPKRHHKCLRSIVKMPQTTTSVQAFCDRR